MVLAISSQAMASPTLLIQTATKMAATELASEATLEALLISSREAERLAVRKITSLALTRYTRETDLTVKERSALYQATSFKGLETLGPRAQGLLSPIIDHIQWNTTIVEFQKRNLLSEASSVTKSVVVSAAMTSKPPTQLKSLSAPKEIALTLQISKRAWKKLSPALGEKYTGGEDQSNEMAILEEYFAGNKKLFPNAQAWIRKTFDYAENGIKKQSDNFLITEEGRKLFKEMGAHGRASLKKRSAVYKPGDIRLDTEEGVRTRLEQLKEMRDEFEQLRPDDIDSDYMRFISHFVPVLLTPSHARNLSLNWPFDENDWPSKWWLYENYDSDAIFEFFKAFGITGITTSKDFAPKTFVPLPDGVLGIIPLNRTAPLSIWVVAIVDGPRLVDGELMFPSEVAFHEAEHFYFSNEYDPVFLTRILYLAEDLPILQRQKVEAAFHMMVHEHYGAMPVTSVRDSVDRAHLEATWLQGVENEGIPFFEHTLPDNFSGTIEEFTEQAIHEYSIVVYKVKESMP